MKNLIMGACMCMAFGVVAADLSVPYGASEEVKQSATYDKVTVAGALTVSGGTLTPTAVSLGGTASEYATITAAGRGAVFGSNIDGMGHVTIGAGGTLGRLVVRDNGQINANRIIVAADAVADPTSGYFDVLDIGPGEVHMSGFTNYAANANVRVLFRGGWLQIGDRWYARLMPNNSTPVCFEGVDGNPIRYRCSGGWTYAYTVQSRGVCDMEVNAVAAIENANFALNNSGWVRFTGGASIAPHATYYGVYFGSNVEGLVISEGTTLKVTPALSGQGIYTPSLDATNGCITVTDQTANYTWTMGNGNKDGFFRASLPNRMTFRKIGTGTTTVDAPSSAETLQIEAGTVRIAAPFACTNLVLKAGATLVVASRLSYGTLTNNGGSIELADGGEITYATDSTQSLVGYNKTGGTLVKEGSGTLTVYDPTAFGGDVCVRNGTIDFSSARGRTEKYWRLTFTKMITGSASQNKYVRVAGIPFYPYELRNETISRTTTGAYVNNGLTDAGVGKDPKTLGAGQASFQCDVTYEAGAPDNWIGVNRYFRGWFNNDYPHLMTPEVDPDTETTLSLAFRLADAAKPVYGYDLINVYGMNRPTSWTLEASTDGINWTVADERANQVAKNAGWSGFASDDNYTSCAFVLPLTYKAAGVANMPTAVGVQVDQGGRLISRT